MLTANQGGTEKIALRNDKWNAFFQSKIIKF